jgi:ferredoxin-NADP reductase
MIEVRIKSITHEAQGIHSIELRPMPGHELAPFDAGAHIDLHLPNGLIRSYSLVNSPQERLRYVIAVHRDPQSRGGSRYVHDELRVGHTIAIGAPRNNFRLEENAPHSVLIAGGIGITPLWCMIQRLEALGRSWELHYGARSRACAAFLDLLPKQDPRVHPSFGTPLGLGAIVDGAAPGAHLYCCGPLAMLAAFEAASASRPTGEVHLEYFATRQRPAVDGAFTVVLAKSGRTFDVPRGKTILDAVLDAGIDAAYSCMEGVCGTCETPVLEGTPDHRDLVLSKQEKESNRTMMICCSGSRGPRLVLDL